MQFFSFLLINDFFAIFYLIGKFNFLSKKRASSLPVALVTIVIFIPNIFGILNSKLNVNAFKQSNISNLNDISDTIETLFIDPSTNKIFVQTDNIYFAVNKFNYLNDSYNN